MHAHITRYLRVDRDVLSRGREGDDDARESEQRNLDPHARAFLSIEWSKCVGHKRPYVTEAIYGATCKQNDDEVRRGRARVRCLRNDVQSGQTEYIDLRNR